MEDNKELAESALTSDIEDLMKIFELTDRDITNMLFRLGLFYYQRDLVKNGIKKIK